MEQKSSYYYRGRAIRMVKHQLIIAEVKEQLGTVVPIIFCAEFRETIRSTWDEKTSHSIGASIYWVDVYFLYLHWFLFYKSQKSYQKKYSIPQATVGEVIEYMCKKVNNEHILLTLRCVIFGRNFWLALNIKIV